MLAAFKISFRNFRAWNSPKKNWMPLTFTCQELFSLNINLYADYFRHGSWGQVPNITGCILNPEPDTVKQQETKLHKQWQTLRTCQRYYRPGDPG